MQDLWVTLATVFFSSTLVLEIYRNIHAALQRKKDRKLIVDEIPSEMKRLGDKVDSLVEHTTSEFADIKRKLAADDARFGRLDASITKMQDAINLNAEGTALGLTNDIVIFNAFRDHHINGESEIAEQKINEFLVKSLKDSFHV